ncbi:MAG: hypothetical protein K9H61_09040 [Bacteroidia bacterium]|nr:hypothetical protein [Bacteroidia bacterium]MCF8427890.1 hypothetical protein [Bacteroidia bacterium]MCF8447125.1 hypothetical protein [Bacteroidia bacterium]
MTHRKTFYIWVAGLFFLLVIATIYAFLESMYYHDFGCGCSSGCIGFYMSSYSKILGYCLILVSFILVFMSLFKTRTISKFWHIPAIVFIGIASYGNGYMLYNKGACGQSLNRTQFYIFQEHLGDFAKIDGEYFSLDSLKQQKYDGKLLGFLLKENKLTVYRINQEPLVIATGFLFWQPNTVEMLKSLSYGLNTFRVAPTVLPEKQIELIGGKDMPLEAFLEELKITNNWGIHKILNQEIIKAPDGTTHLILTIE